MFILIALFFILYKDFDRPINERIGCDPTPNINLKDT